MITTISVEMSSLKSILIELSTMYVSFDFDRLSPNSSYLIFF